MACRLLIVTNYVTIDDMNTTATTGPVPAPRLADWALARGRAALTTADAARLLGVPPDQVRVRLRAPMARGEWVAPARGLWVPVPSQHRGLGSYPAIDYVGAWMGHLGASYYVGWLSAAAIHGAAHHAPQTFQVACSQHVADRQVGRARVEFHARANVARIPVAPRRVAAGDVPVSSREATALDVAAEPVWAAGIDNAANVIVELADGGGLDAALVASLAGLYPAAALRRVGWILANHTDAGGLDPLLRAAAGGGPTASLLSPGGTRRGPVDKDWNLRLNAGLEVDV
jgi:predicted transcriptional regulator of viral defense system